jgi:hypothetical protein
LIKQGDMDGNSMGLILDARNVHHHTLFGSEGRRSLTTVGDDVLRRAWSNKPDSSSHIRFI